MPAVSTGLLLQLHLLQEKRMRVARQLGRQGFPGWLDKELLLLLLSRLLLRHDNLEAARRLRLQVAPMLQQVGRRERHAWHPAFAPQHLSAWCLHWGIALVVPAL